MPCAIPDACWLAHRHYRRVDGCAGFRLEGHRSPLAWPACASCSPEATWTIGFPRFNSHEAARLFRDLGADVQLRIYPGRPHIVSEEEISAARDFLNRIQIG